MPSEGFDFGSTGPVPCPMMPEPHPRKRKLSGIRAEMRKKKDGLRISDTMGITEILASAPHRKAAGVWF